MCQGCKLTEEEALTVTYLDCEGCTVLTTLPELPLCVELNCEGCTALTTLPELPLCIELNCEGCTALTTLPELQSNTKLNCEGCHFSKYLLWRVLVSPSMMGLFAIVTFCAYYEF
jgi:uncharacterized paraquat-inducible protein A